VQEPTGYRAVLLDVDGTLVDSNDAHAHAWVDVGEEAGIDIRFDEVRAMIGMGSDKVLPRLAGVDRESDEGNALAERHGEIFRSSYLPSLSAFPGARDMLEKLLAADITLVVATSASGKDMNAILKQAGLHDLLSLKTNSNDVEDSKPDPDIVHAALLKAGVRAEDAIMIGDTPYDIAAARRAGVRAVAFRCGGWWTDEDLSGATWIYDGPEEFAGLATRSGR
jgi:HAD superfamily hydrolase (TIGR01509 family)